MNFRTFERQLLEAWVESMDFSYIAAQTFGDGELERELLKLFVTQLYRDLLSAFRDADAAIARHLVGPS